MRSGRGDPSPTAIRSQDCLARASAVICAALRAWGERRMAVTERSRLTTARELRLRSPLAKVVIRRGGAPGGEDGEIRARSAVVSSFSLRAISAPNPASSLQSELKCRPFLPGDLWYFPSLESTKHFRTASRNTPFCKQCAIASPPAPAGAEAQKANRLRSGSGPLIMLLSAPEKRAASTRNSVRRRCLPRSPRRSRSLPRSRRLRYRKRRPHPLRSRPRCPSRPRLR